MSYRENKTHPHAEHGNDLYDTPGVAVHALLATGWLPPRIWEPACRPGTIVRELIAAGHELMPTDLVSYGCPGQVAEMDSLKLHGAPFGIDCIVTNPPYKHARAFAEKAVELCPRVMMLRLAFYEGITRGSLLDTGTLARVHIFRKRLPMMHRDGREGPKAASMKAFAWFVWDRSHGGATTLGRLSWEDFYDVEPEPNRCRWRRSRAMVIRSEVLRAMLAAGATS
ncbi:class I SAM-dependent methyltransferase [Methylorubrum extorquens]